MRRCEVQDDELYALTSDPSCVACAGRYACLEQAAWHARVDRVMGWLVCSVLWGVVLFLILMQLD